MDIIDTILRGGERRPSAARRGDRTAGRIACALLAGALALALPGCGRPTSAPGAATPKAQAASRHRQPAERGPRVDDIAQNFKTFALNALLVPLFDDDLPPRWADPSLSFDCEDGNVTVNDAPLDVGAPVQEGSFTVRWHMQRCAPFDDGTELTGDIELLVEPSPSGYRAVIQPVEFHVVSARGHAVLTDAFAARMGIGR